MPSQPLQIRGIFFVALGLFAIWSPRLSQVAPARRDPTGSAPCCPLNRPDGPPADSSCRPRERRPAPSMAKPAETTNQPISSYSPERIALIDHAPPDGTFPSRATPLAGVKGQRADPGRPLPRGPPFRYGEK